MRIWRYIDLAKLVSMFSKKALYFDPPSELIDPFEGYMPRSHVKAHEEIAANNSRGIRAIHLKPVVAAVGGNQPQVMQNRCAKRSFFVDHRTTEAPDSKATEDIGPKAMSAEKLG